MTDGDTPTSDDGRRHAHERFRPDGRGKPRAPARTGAHEFYQGATKVGLLYLRFFWTGIPALIAFVEGIRMLVADEAEYYEKYADGSILGR